MGKFGVHRVALAATLALFGVVATAATTQGQTGGGSQDKASTLRSLEEDAAKQGSVRVIVELKTSFDPTEAVDKDRTMDRRAAVKRIQDEALTDLQPELPDATKVTRFTTVPGIALKATPGVLKKLARSPLVDSISKDFPITPVLVESTPLVGATNAWARGYRGSGKSVAIVDTGIDKTHPFLSGKVIAEACFADTECPNDQEGAYPGAGRPLEGTGRLDWHGTYVGGIAAGGSGGSGSGVAPGAKLISLVAACIACDVDGEVSLLSNAVQSVDWLAPRVGSLNLASINMSFGFPQGNPPNPSDEHRWSDHCDSQAPALKTAVQNLKNQGVATIAAAGNDGDANGILIPSCLSNVVSVAGTNESDQVVTQWFNKPFGTNNAPIVDLLAPAERIRSSCLGPITTGCNNGYVTEAGTSAAAPHVAGAWAILKGLKPGASVDEVLSALQISGRPLTDPRNGLVKPRIDVNAAADRLFPPCCGTRIVNIARDNTVWVKQGGLGAPWFLMTAPEFPGRDIAATDQRLAYILDGSWGGSIWMKQGALAGGWWGMAGPETGAKDVEVSPNRIADIGWDGSVWVKEGGPYAPWSLIAGAEVGAKDVEVTDNRLVFVGWDGSVWGKEGSLSGPGILLAGAETGVKDVELSANRVVYIGWDGSIWGKQGGFGAQGTLIVGPEVGAKDVEVTDNRFMFIGWDGSIWAKEGSFGAPGVLMAGAETGALDIEITPTRLIDIGWDGSIWGKEGSLGAPWLLLAGAETGAKKIAVSK